MIEGFLFYISVFLSAGVFCLLWLCFMVEKITKSLSHDPKTCQKELEVHKKAIAELERRLQEGK